MSVKSRHIPVETLKEAVYLDYSQQITGQDQLYQGLKEHLDYLIQWHGEHESAMNEATTIFVHFLRAIHTIVAIYEPTLCIFKWWCHF